MDIFSIISIICLFFFGIGIMFCQILTALVKFIIRRDFCINCIFNIFDNKGCKRCQINYLKENFTNWSSGNEKIDNFIQKRQSEINDPYETVLEWIPYNQFHDINLFTANWKDGPLYWDRYIRKYNKKSNEVVHLKYLYNFHDIDEILNEVETHSPNFKIYGISQNPDTMVYIIIFRDKDYCIGCKKIYSIAQNKWCEKCLTNDLGKIFDNFIQLKKMGIMNDENSF
ncbi:kinase-like domain-containing protein [Rhizophagus irregularis DAOM 181602=DAOM 197198]|nr:kinase-like domain-containing protein [Rhizophagus irregularis DAOM 181602=DAOM 197198]